MGKRQSKTTGMFEWAKAQKLMEIKLVLKNKSKKIVENESQLRFFV